MFTFDLETLNTLLMFVRHSLSLMGAFIIATGAVFAIYQFIVRIFHFRQYPIFNYDSIRLNLGRSIILGLEFVIAADVIETTTMPDYYSLGILAILIFIRTFSNYFLNYELNELTQKEDVKNG